MRLGKCRWTCALGALIAVAPAAMAQSVSGLYVVGTIGYADQRADLGEFNRAYGLAIPPTADIATFSESKTAYKLGVGYRINQNFAVEGAYGRLGRLTYNVTRPGAAPFGGTFQHLVEPEALQLAAVGILPVSNAFEAFAKAGVASVDNKGGIAQTGGFPPFGVCGGGIVCQIGSTSNDTVGVFGLGLNYNLQSKLFLRAEFEYYSKYKIANAPNLSALGPGAQAGGDIKIHTSVWSVGMGYRF